jgi:hypothetical protein
MEPLAFAIVAALALLVLLRRPGALFPVLLADGPGRWTHPAGPGDDDEQQPETDRAPRRRWLPLCVAALATVRLALLLTLHA